MPTARLSPVPHTRNIANVVAAIALMLVLAACGGGDSQQAKALGDFLQAQVLDKKGVNMPRPTDEQRKSFGRFAADYDIIVKFNDTLTDAMGSKLPELMRRGNITSVAQLVERRDDIAAAREALAGVNKAMVTALADADAARAKLDQPEALKAIYDKAFARLVTDPAAVAGKVWPAIDKALAVSFDFATFATANSAKMKFNGQFAQSDDEKLIGKFNEHVAAMRDAVGGVNEAQIAMQKLVRGE